METKVKKKRMMWEDLETSTAEMKLSLLSNHLEVARLLINEILEEEVLEKAGKRYCRKGIDYPCSRWSTNPGSVKLGDRKVKIEVPRLRENATGKFMCLENYEKLKELDGPSEELQAKVIKGLSTRDYASVAGEMLDSFGVGKSSVAEQTKARMVENLKRFEERDLSRHDIVALVLDGKYLRKHQVIIALGVTIEGGKIPLGFVQSGTENGKVVYGLLSGLVKRGLRYDKGVLVIVDGAKGLSKGVRDFFSDKALIQRCRWHKRENVLGYLREEDKEAVKNRFDVAMNRAKYEDARADLLSLEKDLATLNRSAANSLKEGMEELLTLQKLGMNEKFKRSFGTTNSIESLNSQIGKYTRKVKRWHDSNMIYRWMATALLEIESKMRKVSNAKHLPLLRNKIQKTLNISTKNWT